MPSIDKKLLFTLPVETVSGDQLGKVCDIELDVEQHTVRAYLVRRHLLPNPLRNETNILRIQPHQVRALTAEKMVVDDTAIPAKERSVATATPSATS